MRGEIVLDMSLRTLTRHGHSEPLLLIQDPVSGVYAFSIDGLNAFVYAQVAAVLHSFASIDLQGCVAFLPCLPITLKWLKTKEPAQEPRTIGDHIKKRRLERKRPVEALFPASV